MCSRRRLNFGLWSQEPKISNNNNNNNDANFRYQDRMKSQEDSAKIYQRDASVPRGTGLLLDTLPFKNPWIKRVFNTQRSEMG